jgi:uncharacterized membrane protein (UPF0127 family)
MAKSRQKSFWRKLEINRKYLVGYLASVVGLLFLVSTFLFFYSRHQLDSLPHLKLGRQKIYLEVADSPDTKAQGLSGREGLAANEGMLFMFEKPSSYSFWMKGMKFNLDFVFINGNRVVAIAENVPYPQGCGAPQTVQAGVAFDKALEINQGEIERLGIQVGDMVEFFL